MVQEVGFHKASTLHTNQPEIVAIVQANTPPTLSTNAAEGVVELYALYREQSIHLALFHGGMLRQ